jgi:hypothetical protein
VGLQVPMPSLTVISTSFSGSRPGSSARMTQLPSSTNSSSRIEFVNPSA